LCRRCGARPARASGGMPLPRRQHSARLRRPARGRRRPRRGRRANGDCGGGCPGAAACVALSAGCPRRRCGCHIVRLSRRCRVGWRGPGRGQRPRGRSFDGHRGGGSRAGPAVCCFLRAGRPRCSRRRCAARRAQGPSSVRPRAARGRDYLWRPCGEPDECRQSGLRIASVVQSPDRTASTRGRPASWRTSRQMHGRC